MTRNPGWSPGLAPVCGGWFVSEEKQNRKNPGELQSDIFSLTLCPLPPVPPKVTVLPACSRRQRHLEPILHLVSLEEGLGAR